MTSVVKVGGKSQRTPEMVEGFVSQACSYFRDERVLWDFSAIDNTTDRLVKMLGGKKEALRYPHERFLSADLLSKYEETLGQFDMLYAACKATPVAANKAAFLAHGERVAAILGAAAINRVGRKAVFLDYDDPDFPVVASAGENYLSACFDSRLSSERAGRVLKILDAQDVVIPGFAGISGGLIKTLGRGGTDESALGCGSVLGANDIYLCTDVDGIMQAVVGKELNPQTVEELDIEEAEAGAFLGAKLPSEQALVPLQESYERGHFPNVYIANASNLGGRKTRIVQSTEANGVKFVAGREIPLYAVIEGRKEKLLEFEARLTGLGTDYLIAVQSGTRGEIAMFGKGSDMPAERFVELCNEFQIRAKIDQSRAIVGVVGGGIKDMKGVDEKLYAALRRAGVNVLSSHDYSDFSTGSMISSEDRQKAITSIYRAFFME